LRLGPRFEYSWVAGLWGLAYPPGEWRPQLRIQRTSVALARLFTASGIECVVVAPSMLQRPVGDRVKTDAVTVPTIEQETARDLVRAREDSRGELMAARHRLSKLLPRHGIIYDGKQAWTGALDAWLRRQMFDHAELQAAFDADYEAVQQMATSSDSAPVVRRRGCLRGISTLTGFGLAVEIGNGERFTGSSIGAFVGLCPRNTPPDSPARKKRPTIANVAIARELAGWC